MTSNNQNLDYNYGLSLSLVLYGLKIHPDKATSILAIKPTTSRGIGDAGVINGTTMRIRLIPSKKHIWAFSTRRIDDSEFSDHWEILYKQIKSKEKNFAEIRKFVDDIAVSINIGFGRFIPGIEIPPDILGILARFNFRLDYDVVM